LHGRAAGSVDRAHNVPGTPVIDDDEARERADFQRLKHPPVIFDTRQRSVIERTIHEVCQHRQWKLHAVHVRTNHVHLVASAPTAPERVMNDLKSYATRRMVEAGLFPADTRAWTRHGSTRYLWDMDSVRKACEYVNERQGVELAAGEVPLPDGRGSDNSRGSVLVCGSDIYMVRGPDSTGPSRDRKGVEHRIVFGIQTDVPVQGGNAAQKREHDKRIGAGTMSRAGATCPCCGAINTMEDIRLEGKAGRLGSVMTAVVVDGQNGKEYRLPTEHELSAAAIGEEQIQAAFKDVPFGVPEEPTPKGGGSGAGRAFSVQGYGLMRWRDLFTSRQLVALGTFVSATRAARQAMASDGYPPEWIAAIGAYLAITVDRMAERNSELCHFDISRDTVSGTFQRYALPINWDFAEASPIGDSAGCYSGQIDWVGQFIDHGLVAGNAAPATEVRRMSSTQSTGEQFDAIVTAPPYYDAIPYSDLMDYFYIWLRRSATGLAPAIDVPFSGQLSPKWDHDSNDGELIDDCSRHGNDAGKSRQVYEDGMAAVFAQCATALRAGGRLVIVFANKQPDAWETLVSAIIRAGFVADGSWPIQTEMANRTRAMSSAALASSVWLVCKKRAENARPGWDNAVLEEMRANIAIKLHDFWDAGIRGPDFVWAATGPALEAYSKHPVVRKADEPNATMSVGEFLVHVRRMVVDFVVGRVLGGPLPDGRGSDMGCGPGAVEPSRDREGAEIPTDRLDEVTAYYLLHRNDFGLGDAPVGACILYATACGLSDTELEKTWNILTRTGSHDDPTENDPTENDPTQDDPSRDREGADNSPDDSDSETEEESGGGSKVRLNAWSQRHGKSMGYDAPNGKAVPLIDRIHRLMHLWKQGDVHKVDEYLDECALRKNELFRRVIQSLIELSENSERSILESISNHVGARGTRADVDQLKMGFTRDGNSG
jgi:REP element-mobilizing transposase RayT